MNINIKTLQVTLVKLATEANTDKQSAIQEPLDENQLQQVTVVEVIGDVDTNTAPLVQEQILSLVQPAARMILDMTQVPYMSSAGLRMLLSLYRKISSIGEQVVLVGLSEEIKDTMSITGFLDFFVTRETLALALEALSVRIQVIPASSKTLLLNQ